MSKLTRRQRHVLEMVVETGSLRAAARAMGISEHTIKNHMLDIRKRIKLSTYQIMYALGSGDLDEDKP